MKILQTKNITKKFDGVCALNDLSAGLRKGEVTGIIGPNGSGKTTLINALSGMLAVTEGVIVVKEDQEVHNMRPHTAWSHGITRTFQEPRLFRQMTVLENILVAVTDRSIQNTLFKKHNEQHNKNAMKALQKVGLENMTKQQAQHLSYGQQKLLEIARVIATDVEVCLLDEPFAGLFPEMVKRVSTIIQDLKKEQKGVVLIEHNMNLIRQLSDHVLVMDEGVLIAEGAPKEVLEREEVVSAYLGK